MKRALITGASSPIGAAIAQALAAEGHELILQANRNIGAAEALADTLRSQGAEATALSLDLCAEGSSERLAEMANANPIEIFVHGVGGQRDMPFAAMERSDWSDIIELNLTSFFNTLQPIILPMMRARWGRIVAI